LLGLVVVESISIPQQQHAYARGCESSFPHSGGGGIGFNARRMLLQMLAYNFCFFGDILKTRMTPDFTASIMTL
jgi:hypothetical protein